MLRDLGDNASLINHLHLHMLMSRRGQNDEIFARPWITSVVLGPVTKPYTFDPQVCETRIYAFAHGRLNRLDNVAVGPETIGDLVNRLQLTPTHYIFRFTKRFESGQSYHLYVYTVPTKAKTQTLVA